MPKPIRKRKGDRLLHGHANADEIKCDYAVAPLDKLALQMDEKWGIDVLPELVSPALAEKYGAAIAHLNKCMSEHDPAKTTAAAANCIRGLNAMNAEAEATGAHKATGAFWEIEIEPEPGDDEPFRMAVLESDREWKTAKDARPDLQFFTKREVAIAMRFYAKNALVMETKKHFPKARIKHIKADPPVNYAQGGDEIIL